ncbi:MAG: uroporphyrinogen decarboxylase family protein [Thermacetogeniaceae bacterium]
MRPGRPKGGNDMNGLTPDFRRLETALQHREPDRVPLVETTIAYEIMSRLLGREVTATDLQAQVEFWAKAGYDFIPLTAGMMQPGKVTENSAISKVIKKMIIKDQDNDDAWNLEKRAFIFNEDDFNHFPWDEAAKLDYSDFYQVQQYLPEGMKIIALSGKIFTLSWLLMGYENFCINLMLNPGLIEKIIIRVSEIQFAGIEKAITIPNVAAVWCIDDIAFGTGTMIGPKHLRQYIFPWYEKVVKLCHDKGLYVFYHTDGMIREILDDLIGLGFDALHPIDPTCMDIVELKKKIGDRISLFGNVATDLLQNGTPEEVEAVTREKIRVLAPGGGYCLASGNSVPEWAKFENYQAMITAALKYGKYPISL